MSYILNALKKAENKSFDGENSKVQKQILVLKRRSRSSKLKVIFIISGLLGTLLLGGLLGYMQTGDGRTPVVDTQVQTVSDNKTPAPAEHQPVIAQPTLTPPHKIAEEVRPEKIQQNKPVATSSIDKVSPPVPVRTATMTAKPQLAETIQPAMEQAAEKKMEQSLPRYAEIPLRVKQTLPSLKISLHFYNSIPEKRLVRINGTNLHEGDFIEEGLAIEEIKPTTTVLNHDGYLFELNAPGG